MNSDIKNVILITVDALRADHIGYMGYNKSTTPNIDDFANECIVFKRAYANGPFTRPSFISILSSTYPLMYDGYFKLSRHRPVVQSTITKNGIQTGAIHSNTYLSRYYGYNRGFNYFYDSFGKKIKKKTYLRRLKKSLIKKIRKKSTIHNLMKKIYYMFNEKKKRPYEIAESITKKSMKFLKENKENRFFLWTHYMDPHYPYNPPSYIGNIPPKKEKLNKIKKGNGYSPKDKEPLINLYDGEIRYTDFWIEKLLDELKNLELLKNTAIIITADHGEEFFEHGDIHHPSKLYNELLHVPLLVYHPNMKSKKVKTPVELLDISPTILDILNLEYPKSFLGESLLQKRDFSPVISEVSNETNNWEIDLDVRKTSCIIGDWKYIMGQKNNNELYNLKNDSLEQNNLVGSHPKLEDELKTVIQKHRSKYKPMTEII